MSRHYLEKIDFGTGEKRLGLYFKGVIFCVILTLISFWVVGSKQYTFTESFILIFLSAIIQFIVQVIFFLRLNTQTEQGLTNVLSFVFTGVILVCIVSGSIWIIWHLHYNIMIPMPNALPGHM